MAENLIKRLEQRINSKFFKGEFLNILKKKAEYCKWDDEWVYRLNLTRQQIESILHYPLAGNESHLIVVGLKNGTLKLKDVA